VERVEIALADQAGEGELDAQRRELANRRLRKVA
jgi:hypothetical protein